MKGRGQKQDSFLLGEDYKRRRLVFKGKLNPFSCSAIFSIHVQTDRDHPLPNLFLHPFWSDYCSKNIIQQFSWEGRATPNLANEIFESVLALWHWRALRMALGNNPNWKISISGPSLTWIKPTFGKKSSFIRFWKACLLLPRLQKKSRSTLTTN